jgi:hypothetical protein
MKISAHTLNLMRHSAGVVITAMAISGESIAASTEHADFIQSTSLESHSGSELEPLNSAVEEPKKEEEEKKNGKKDPCLGCGRG